jgi:hypothetical protein
MAEIRAIRQRDLQESGYGSYISLNTYLKNRKLREKLETV